MNKGGPLRFFHDAAASHQSDLMLSRSFSERPYMVYRIHVVDTPHDDDEREDTLAHSVFDVVLVLPIIVATQTWSFQNDTTLEHLFDCVGIIMMKHDTKFNNHVC